MPGSITLAVERLRSPQVPPVPALPCGRRSEKVALTLAHPSGAIKRYRPLEAGPGSPASFFSTRKSRHLGCCSIGYAGSVATVELSNWAPFASLEKWFGNVDRCGVVQRSRWARGSGATPCAIRDAICDTSGCATRKPVFKHARLVPPLEAASKQSTDGKCRDVIIGARPTNNPKDKQVSRSVATVIPEIGLIRPISQSGAKDRYKQNPKRAQDCSEQLNEVNCAATSWLGNTGKPPTTTSWKILIGSRDSALAALAPRNTLNPPFNLPYSRQRRTGYKAAAATAPATMEST